MIPKRPFAASMQARLAATALVVLTIGCSRVPVGIMTKLQAGSIVGSSEINAAKLFLEDHPGSRIEIVPADDGWDARKAMAAYDDLRARGVSIIVTSHVSTSAMAISDAVNRDDVLALVAGAATDRLSGKDDHHVRLIQDVASEQRSIARFVNARPEARVLVVRDTDNHLYTTPALDHFRQALAKPLVRVIDFSIAGLNVDSLGREIARQPFDIAYILVGGYNITAGSVAQLLFRINPRAPILFTPWMRTPTIMETLGGAARNAIMPSHYPPRRESQAIARYIDRFKKKFGYTPTFISLNVFRALEIIDRAIGEGKRSPAAIKRYIIDTKTFETSFGPITFDRNGDVDAPLYFLTDLPGEF